MVTSGLFDPIGLANVYEKVTGQSLPVDAIALSGNYRVYTEDYGRGIISLNYKAYFRFPPENIEKLMSEIVNYWEKQFCTIPDWKIRPARFGAKDFGAIKVSDSSMLITVSNSYVYYRELYRVIIDPTTGVVIVIGVNDRNESPTDRQVEADNAQMDKERESRSSK